MRLLKSSSSLVLAVLLCGSPVLADESVAESEASTGTAIETMIDNQTEGAVPTDGFEFAAVDFCYMGSIVDQDTGEVMDIYGLCSNDAIEGNLDLA